MNKRIIKMLLVVCLSLGFFTLSFAQRQTGSIKGIVCDTEDNPLPGCTVTAASESLMGTRSYVTAATGAFRFPALPPGQYTITAEIPGFKTTTRGNLVCRVGMVVSVHITMEMATIKEEVTVTAASPTVDVEQTKIAITMDKDLLKNIPMARDLYDIVNSAPGAISENVSYRRTTSVHGSTVRGNTYAFDGVNLNDPVTMYPITNINFDVMDEVELVVAGHPADVGYTDGAYVNVVTRSGGNTLSGGTTIYYTNDSLAQKLWTDEQIHAFEVSEPEVDKSWIDGSLSLGGPIMANRLWFFTNARYIKQTLRTNFIPFTDPVYGKYHGPYDWTHEEIMGFLKLTSQFTSNLKLMGMFNFVDRYRPLYNEPDPRRPQQSYKVMDHERTYTGNGILTYVLNQNTFFEVRGSYVHRWFPLLLQEDIVDLPFIRNRGALYQIITGGTGNETYLRKRFQTGAYFTRFQDNFLGGNHEIKGGVEFEDAFADRSCWRKDNLQWHWRKGNPYYHGTKTWKGVPDVGKGRIYFSIYGPEEGSLLYLAKSRRIGAYLQDSITYADRLTLNIGLRFDRSWGWMPAFTKPACGNPVSIYVGEKLVRPYTAEKWPETFPEGINPFGELRSEELKDLMVWNSWSPRIGLTYDLFGDGKTALKASFSRYSEYMMIQYFNVLHPFYTFQAPRFYWYDMNFNQQVDIEDDFTIFPLDYRAFDPSFSSNKLDPDIKSPLNDEFTMGIWHELLKNFSLGINFIYKNKKNIFEDGLYDPDTGESWYHLDHPAAQKYWIPFTTIIPSDVYGDQKVTFYVRSNDSPEIFWRATNIPELKRKYWAFELIFNKRMADGWQLSGSVVLSKAYGNIGGWFTQSSGWTGKGDTPNDFVNSYGRTPIDRPLQIKLMGTAELPYRIFLSAYYRFFSGGPWINRGNIVPPESWCEANNAYYQEYWVRWESRASPRRYRSWNILDLRLEKEFMIGDFGRLGVYVDALNVLGMSGVDMGMRDVEYYYPVAENDNTGEVKTLADYKVINSAEGIRQIKFSVRFIF
ncbi:MAG: TonB-dependent receptor [Candidatus Aminicenantes bacterium]|nr:MAG: TonB-dependent receptor [Candidatus Aminicenantes bacterium]